MHLKQAGKFEGVRGIVLGDFPECEPPVAGAPTVRDVCCANSRAAGSADCVWSAGWAYTAADVDGAVGRKGAIGRKGEGMLEILEPAVVA